MSEQMNRFYWPCFWESKVKIGFPSLEILWEKWGDNLCTFSLSLYFYKDSGFSMKQKTELKGILIWCLISSRMMRVLFFYISICRGKAWSASASSSGCSDQVLRKGKCYSRVPRTKSSPKLQKEDSLKVVTTRM